VNIPLGRLEEIIDSSRIAGRIEMLLPAGVRPRQLTVRTGLVAEAAPDVDDDVPVDVKDERCAQLLARVQVPRQRAAQRLEPLIAHPHVCPPWPFSSARGPKLKPTLAAARRPR